MYQQTKSLKYRFQELFWSLTALLCGAAILYLGLRYALNVRLDVFFGISTFSPAWIAGVFLFPFIGGIVVSIVYGLGGKILAHFPPLLVLIPDYIQIKQAVLPPEVTVLPLGYWFLVVILTMEFSALGGIVGEVLVKRTYGRTPKDQLHKRFQEDSNNSGEKDKLAN